MKSATLARPARPRCWLGAPTPGRLALPDAHPTPSQLYGPRGVYLDERCLIAADSGNHRVLIWHGLPTADGQPADVVLGQPDFYREGPRAGGRDPANGMHLPTGVAVIAGRLLVADAWHHRILVWERVPERSAQPPDYILGQGTPTAIEPNRGGAPDGASFYWPFGLGFVGGWFYVADTGNRRLLGWRGLPAPGQPADLVLGQSSAADREENRGGPAGPCSFRWPHAVAGDAETLFVADAGNHRVLGWRGTPSPDAPADLVLGQPDFAQSAEWPYAPPGPGRLRFPYGLACDGGRLAVGDTANNRVLLYDAAPRAGAFVPADAVLGQPDFDASGENRWRAVEHDTLCWPYGVHMHGDLIAVADSGNNRVMLWQLGPDDDNVT